jgi:membrane protease YdiL (CAAX protease family)
MTAPIETPLEPVREPPPPRPLTAGRAIAILLVFLLVQLGVAVVFDVAAQGYWQSRITDPAALNAKVQSVTLLPAALLGTALGALAAFKMTRRSFPGPMSSGALAAVGWSSASSGVVAASAALGASIALSVVYAIFRYLPPHAGQHFGPMVEAFAKPGASRLLLAAIAVAVAPPAEEFLFRGVLLRGIAHSWGMTTAVVITTLTFIALHVPEVYGYWPALIGISLMATIAVTIRLATRSLAPSIALHAAYNLALVVMAYGHRA